MSAFGGTTDVERSRVDVCLWDPNQKFGLQARNCLRFNLASRGHPAPTSSSLCSGARLAFGGNLLKGLLAFGLAKRSLVLLGLLAFIDAGTFAFSRLNIEAYPNPAPVILEITARSPGLSAGPGREQVISEVDRRSKLAGWREIGNYGGRTLQHFGHLTILRVVVTQKGVACGSGRAAVIEPGDYWSGVPDSGLYLRTDDRRPAAKVRQFLPFRRQVEILPRKQIDRGIGEQSLLVRCCVPEPDDLDDLFKLENVGEVIVIVDIVELGLVVGRDLERDHHAERRRTSAGSLNCHGYWDLSDEFGS